MELQPPPQKGQGFSERDMLIDWYVRSGVDRELAARGLGLAHGVIEYGRVGSVAEAAEARGVAVADVVKTLVVRRGEGDHLLVLVPGGRSISWPALRARLRCRCPPKECRRWCSPAAGGSSRWACWPW